MARIAGRPLLIPDAAERWRALHTQIVEALETLAEGIEDHEQLRALQRQDCDMGQGFLLARPLEVEAADAFLDAYGTSALASGCAVLGAGVATVCMDDTLIPFITQTWTCSVDVFRKTRSGFGGP